MTDVILNVHLKSYNTSDGCCYDHSRIDSIGLQ